MKTPENNKQRVEESWASTPRWPSSKEPACQCRGCERFRFNPWVREIPWERAWQPILVFLPGESQQRSPMGGLQSIKSQTIRHEVTTHTHTPKRVNFWMKRIALSFSFLCLLFNESRHKSASFKALKTLMGSPQSCWFEEPEERVWSNYNYREK